MTTVFKLHSFVQSVDHKSGHKQLNISAFMNLLLEYCSFAIEPILSSNPLCVTDDKQRLRSLHLEFGEYAGNCSSNEIDPLSEDLGTILI